MMRTFRFVLFGIVFALVGCASSAQQSAPPDRSEIHLASPAGEQIVVDAEIAADNASQARGLMERTELAPDAGMLFVFLKPQLLAFWMKDTLIPLDILFFEENGSLVSWAHMDPCPPSSSGNCPSTLSRGPAKYALEVPAGFVARYGIGSDWKLALQPWMRNP